jgi:hypothetical protein
MAEDKKQTKAEEKKSLHAEIVKQMVTLSTSGFGLVAALAWNNVIKEFVDNYIDKWLPQGGGLLSLFIYAIAVTALAVFVTLQLSKLAKALGEDK